MDHLIILKSQRIVERYIKSKLGKHRLTNWINFLNFIKEESKEY